MTSTLHSPDNFEIKSHTWKNAGLGFHRSFPGFQVPHSFNQDGSTFICFIYQDSVFKFLLKEVRNVLM